MQVSKVAVVATGALATAAALGSTPAFADSPSTPEVAPTTVGLLDYEARHRAADEAVRELAGQWLTALPGASATSAAGFVLAYPGPDPDPDPRPIPDPDPDPDPRPLPDPDPDPGYRTPPVEPPVLTPPIGLPRPYELGLDQVGADLPAGLPAAELPGVAPAEQLNSHRAGSGGRAGSRVEQLNAPGPDFPGPDAPGAAEAGLGVSGGLLPAIGTQPATQAASGSLVPGGLVPAADVVDVRQLLG